MSDLQPDNTAAILGGQNPPPVDAAVLGGKAGDNRKLAHTLGLSYELVNELIHTHQLFSFETVNVNWWGEIIDPTQKQAFYYREHLNDEIALDMVYIPAGSFLMGAPDDEEGSEAFEIPQHLVTLPAFHMSKFQITQAQYQAVMLDSHSSQFVGDNLAIPLVGFKQRLFVSIYLKNVVNLILYQVRVSGNMLADLELPLRSILVKLLTPMLLIMMVTIPIEIDRKD
jgi:Sulfatase-modifying factor enzyme 1